MLLNNGVDRAFKVPVGVPLGLPELISFVVLARVRGRDGFGLVAGPFTDLARFFKDPGGLGVDFVGAGGSGALWTGVDVGVEFGEGSLSTESVTELMNSTK